MSRASGSSRLASSRIARSTAERIEVRGFDLTEDLIGRVNLGDMAFLELKARLPTPGESAVINALLVSLVEHGLTPSVLASRLTLLGAPESLQGAVAAGLLGLGSVFVGSIEGAARMVQEAWEGAEGQEVEIAALATDAVAAHRARGTLIPGLGHNIHRGADPRTERLIAIARANGVAGRHVDLILAIAAEAEVAYGRHLPVNATGAIGAVASDLGIPWRVCRGLGVIARAVGLVGHLLEEMEAPIAHDLWDLAESRNAESDGGQ